jgi:hypothetical protein
LESDERHPPTGEVALHRHRLGTSVLDVDLQMILEVFAHSGDLDDRLHPDRLEVGGLTDAQQLEQLRRVECTAANLQNALARSGAPRSSWRYASGQGCLV